MYIDIISDFGFIERYFLNALLGACPRIDKARGQAPSFPRDHIMTLFSHLFIEFYRFMLFPDWLLEILLLFFLEEFFYQLGQFVNIDSDSHDVGLKHEKIIGFFE